MSEDWRHRAACRDEDPERFFPVGNSGPALLQIAEAKSVCHRCDVASRCLAWALESGQDDGVWGGMSEDERRPLMTGRRKPDTVGRIHRKGPEVNKKALETRVETACRMKAEGVPIPEIAWHLSVSQSSVKRYLYGASK